jgi:ABC-type sugar transport system permease subunit
MIKQRSDRLYSYLLLAPAFLIVILLILLPEISAVLLGFTNYSPGANFRIVGLRNYFTIIGDGVFWRDVLTNIVFVLASVFLQLIVGLFLALLFAKRFWGQKLWIALILAPLAMTPSVSATIWKYLLDFNIGPVNYFLQRLSLPRLQWFSSYPLALFSVILIYVWQCSPYVFIMLYPARVSIASTIYEAASIDGASPWQILFSITLPLLKPIIFIALVYRTIFALRAFGAVWNLTGGGPFGKTEIMSIYLFKQGFVYWKFGLAAAVATIMLILTVLLSGGLIKNMYRTTFSKD